jgi:hypothetical protein
MAGEKADGKVYASPATHIYGAGLNAHGQLLRGEADDLLSFRKIKEAAGTNLKVWFASWSSTIFAMDGGRIEGIGHQKVVDNGHPWLSSPIGDHDGVILALDSGGQLYRAAEQEEDGTIIMVCQSTDSSPSIGRLARAENGRIAITIKQAPNGNLCHIEEFKEIDTFLRWFKDPSGDGNYPEKHFMLPGRPKQLEANTGTFVLLMESGQVYTWGDARYRSLGRSTSGYGSRPADEPGIVEALQGVEIEKIACRGWMSAALSCDRALYLWGIASPSQDVEINALSPGEGEELALVDIPGSDAEPLEICDVALGVEHIAVLADAEGGGRLFVAGDNSCGQLSLFNMQTYAEKWQEVKLPIPHISAIFCGPRSTFALVYGHSSEFSSSLSQSQRSS